MTMLTLESALRQRASRMRRHKMNAPTFRSDRLELDPIADPYALSTGSVDRYLEKLREVHGDRQGKTDP